MAMLRVKWLTMGVPVGFWWGWKKSNVWDVEKVVESVLPWPVAKYVVDLLPKGTADTRQKVRLQESIRENGRRQEETIRKQQESAARQEHLLQTLLARLPEANDHRLAQKHDSPTSPQKH